MRGLGLVARLVGTVALLGVAVPRTAAADTMDPALNRLVTTSNCRTTQTGTAGASGVFYNPTSGFVPCGTNDGAFAQLIAQYGAAVAPSAMHSARTTGYGGFKLALEGDFTSIDSSASYWQNGTQGPQDPNSKLFSVINKTPPSFLQLYNLNISKGLPFGFELAANFGYLSQSSIFTIGADVRWSIFEGFRTGVPAFFPELAVGGGVRTITGTDQFQLTVASADGELSKPIPIAGTVVLTPWIGYQFMRIFGDSGLIDLTPNTDASNYCGFTGPNTPANHLPGVTVFDGQPVCKGGSSADYNNTVVFAPARLNRHRLFGGLGLRIQMIQIGGQFMMDVVDPGKANPMDTSTINGIPGYQGKNPYLSVNRQMTIAVDVGAVF